MIDCRCPKCGATKVDVLLRDEDQTYPLCYAELEHYPGFAQRLICGTRMERVHLPTGRGTVIGDDIPGGTLVSNGICNADGSPKRYYSKSEMARAAADKGLTNYVVHQGTKGGDKSKMTTRWT